MNPLVRLVLLVALDVGVMAAAYAGRFLVSGLLLALATVVLSARRQ